jgi:hypothetical protein
MDIKIIISILIMDLELEKEIKTLDEEVLVDEEPVECRINNEFIKLLREFIPDLSKEFTTDLDDSIKALIEQGDDIDNDIYEKVYTHSRSVFPERCLDIMYENEDMFSDDNLRTDFFLNIEFKELWKDATENTKTILWKYLQLFLFVIMPDITDTAMFGEKTFRLFEMIDEDQFKDKMNETMKELHGFFENADMKNMKSEDMPNVDDIHDHMKGLFDGKLGSLAKEISEELYAEMDFSDLEESMKEGNDASYDTIFKKLMKNPTQIFEMIQNIRTKLQTKIESGEIKESELMQNAYDMMEKMKNSKIPGMDKFNDILKSFGSMGTPGGSMNNANVSATQNNLSRVMKRSQTRERMQALLQKRREEKLTITGGVLSGEGENQIYTIESNPPERSIAKKKKKKKKKKKQN